MRRTCGPTRTSAGSPLLLLLMFLALAMEQRWIGAAAGLADLVSQYLGGDANRPETAVGIAARNCATNSSSDACQPRTVLALQNGGPETHPQVLDNKKTHTPDIGDMRADAARYHTGSATTLTWSNANTEANIAALLLAALGPEIEASLAAEAWGPISSPTQRWQVYRVDGERVHSWADIVTAPTMQSIAEQYGVRNASTRVHASALGDVQHQESGNLDLDTNLALSSASDVPALYVVPEGRLFMWPTHQIGQLVPVPGCTHGRAPGDPPVTLETINTSPRIFRIRNFLSATEAEEIIDEALSISDDMYKLQRSGTGHIPKSSTKQQSTVASTRTSDNAFVSRGALAEKIKRRAFELLRIEQFDMKQGDGIQVLRYQHGQAYIEHTDYFPVTPKPDWNWNPARNGSNRFATVFLYLSDVELGGQTVFSKAHIPDGWSAHAPPALTAGGQPVDLTSGHGEDSWEAKMTMTCESKFSVSPRKGDAMVFYSQNPDGSVNPASLHGGCPVLEGTKWAANLWVWNSQRFKTGSTANPDGEGAPHIPNPNRAGISSQELQARERATKTAEERKVSAQFVNDLDQAVSLWWRRDATTFKHILNIRAGARSGMTTYPNHRWAVYREQPATAQPVGPVLREFTVLPQDAGRTKEYHIDGIGATGGMHQSSERLAP